MNRQDDVTIAHADSEAVKNCPGCGNLMVYEPQSRSMYCEACKTTVALDLETGAGVYEEMDFDSIDESKLNHNWGTGKFSVRCKSCGAETVVDDTVHSGSCSFCGSSQVTQTPIEASDAITPTHLIPFTVSLKKALGLFTDWIKGKFFVPKKCKQSVSAEKLKGVYVPYWTFDANTQGAYTAQYGTERTVTRTRTVTRDGKSEIETYTEIVIDWHNTAGQYEQFFDDVLIPASKNTIKELMAELEPFDYTKLLAFKPQFLSGFMAERYTVGLKDGWNLATARISEGITKTITSQVMDRHGTCHVQHVRFDTNYYDRTFKHILLPIWFSSYTYRNKQYYFMVNGQTGKVSGNAPTSVFKVFLCVLAGIAVVGVIAWLLGLI